MILLIGLWSITSCHPNAQKTTAADNEKLIRQYFEYFNQHDWKKMAAMYTETADFKDPSLEKGIIKQTREQVVEKYTGLGDLFPDIKDKIVNIYPSGDKNVIVEFISIGTAPDGSLLELPICAIFTIEKGAITKDYTYYNNCPE